VTHLVNRSIFLIKNNVFKELWKYIDIVVYEKSIMQEEMATFMSTQ